MLEGPCAESEEKHEPASDADAAVVDSLKALDLNRPIREADIAERNRHVRFVPQADIMQCSSRTGSRVLAVTGKVDYGVDDDTGRDGDQVRYEAEVDA